LLFCVTVITCIRLLGGRVSKVKARMEMGDISY